MYSELIKNFDRIREYMRQFYVYGFRSREEFTQKSLRVYDDEKRRIESYLVEYMSFQRNADGKNIFISIDSRATHHNPLYRPWKAKSFTDGDITLHFIIFDILFDENTRLTLVQIMDQIDEYLSCFCEPKFFDESTVRKKLKEYADIGIIKMEKSGRTVVYSRAPSDGIACIAKTDHTKGDEEATNLSSTKGSYPSGKEKLYSYDICDTEILDFFSEIAPCGVVGSYLLDKGREGREHFVFKHHYITGAMDSEIVYMLLVAIRDKCMVSVEIINAKEDPNRNIIPLQMMMSAQSGRQYVMAYTPQYESISAYRVDHIKSVKIGEVCEDYDALRDRLDDMKKHMWGVSTRDTLEQVAFTIYVGADEEYILRRIDREKRCGSVKCMDETHYRFEASVYDAGELIPWMRTFIGRISDVFFSDSKKQELFEDDIKHMYALYDIGGGL